MMKEFYVYTQCINVCVYVLVNQVLYPYIDKISDERQVKGVKVYFRLHFEVIQHIIAVAGTRGAYSHCVLSLKNEKEFSHVLKAQGIISPGENVFPTVLQTYQTAPCYMVTFQIYHNRC